MRLAVAGPTLLLLALTVPLAGAQVASSSLDVLVKVPDEVPEAGKETAVVFTVTRHCANPSQVLPEQVVEVAIHPRDSNTTAAGPGQVLFPQQVCATQPQRSAGVVYDVRTPRDALPGDIYEFHAVFAPRAGSTPSIAGPGNEASATFVIGVAPTPPTAAQLAAIEDEGEGQDAPALPAILLALALLGAAFALRHRA